eukprot:gene682-biopygen1107
MVMPNLLRQKPSKHIKFEEISGESELSELKADLVLQKFPLPTKSAAYADDVTATGSLINRKNWWESLIELDPKFGNFPEATKSWLIVKDDTIDVAERSSKAPT